jgi:hypothetical protein
MLLINLICVSLLIGSLPKAATMGVYRFTKEEPAGNLSHKDHIFHIFHRRYGPQTRLFAYLSRDMYTIAPTFTREIIIIIRVFFVKLIDQIRPLVIDIFFVG